MGFGTIIIGGGVIGLAIARLLHKRGQRDLVVIEREACGMESSWAAGGMLSPQVESAVDGPLFELAAASRDLYPALAGELLNETGIDIELDCTGTLYLAFDDKDLAEISAVFVEQRREGLAVDLLSPADVREIEPGLSADVAGALRFPDDWQVDNRKLLAALRRYCDLNGITIVESLSVDSLFLVGNRVVGAQSAGEDFRGGPVILATGAWTSLIKIGAADMPFSVEPVRGQMICFNTGARRLGHVVYSSEGYIIPRLDGRVLAGSTSERVGFEKAVDYAGGERLHAMASRIAPMLGGLPIFDRWSGLRPCAPDELPVIGPIDGIDGLVVATGHYRNGIPLAPVTAELVAGHLCEERPEAIPVHFSPGRFGASQTAAGG